MVAAASIDRVVHVWSTQTHKILHRLDGHTESVYCVTFSTDGNRLVSGGLDKTIKARSRSSPRRRALVPGPRRVPPPSLGRLCVVCSVVVCSVVGACFFV